jgi:hypothetical protein
LVDDAALLEGGTLLAGTSLPWRRSDACAMRARTLARRRDMPMLFWLPMIFASAMLELSASTNRQAKSNEE